MSKHTLILDQVNTWTCKFKLKLDEWSRQACKYWLRTWQCTIVGQFDKGKANLDLMSMKTYWQRFMKKKCAPSIQQSSLHLLMRSLSVPIMRTFERWNKTSEWHKERPWCFTCENNLVANLMNIVTKCQYIDSNGSMKTTGKDSWSKSVLHQLNKFHSISRWGVWVCPLWGHLRGEATPLDGAKRDLDASLVRIICCLFDDYCHKISIYRLNLTFLNKNLTLDHDTTLLHMMNIDFILLFII